MTPVVDIHAHLLDPHALVVAGPHGAASGFGARPSIPPPGSRFAEINALMLDPARQVAAMDERGVDVYLVSAILAVTPTGWADAPTALDLNRRYNDHIAEAAYDHPRRLVGSFSLPLQDLELALGELERAVVQLGLGVIQLPASIDGVYLGEPPLRPLWEEIARRDLLAFIHPDGVRDPWFQKYSLWNSVGQPIEEARVLASLIYEGVLVTQVGADHLLMGSDWPVGEADPIGFVERCPGLSDDDRAAILGGTAASLLELA